MTQTESTPQRGLPAWLTITVLAAVVIGGGIFVWYKFVSSSVNRSAMASALQDGVRPFYGNPTYGKRGDSEFARYGNEMWAFYKLQDLDRVALHAIADLNLAQQLKITKEQRDALQKLTWGIQLTAEERKKIDSLLADCRKAMSEGMGAVGLANNAMLDGFDEIVRKHAHEADSATSSRQKQITAILKPEQIAEGETWLKEQMENQRWMPAVPPKPGAAPSTVRRQPNRTFGQALREWAAQPSSRPAAPRPAAPPRPRGGN